MGVLARNYEKIYFRENVVETKNLPPYFPISLVRTKKKKNQFLALKKKVNRRKFQKCTQLKLAPVPGSARNLRKSYRGIFEKTPYMYSMGVLADIVFFFRLQYGKPLASIPGNHWETNTIFFFFGQFFFTTAQKLFFTRFFRYFGINLVHFRPILKNYHIQYGV